MSEDVIARFYAKPTVYIADGDRPVPEASPSDGWANGPDNAGSRTRMNFVEPTMNPVVRTRRADP